MLVIRLSKRALDSVNSAGQTCLDRDWRGQDQQAVDNLSQIGVNDFHLKGKRKPERTGQLRYIFHTKRRGPSLLRFVYSYHLVIAMFCCIGVAFA